MMKRIHLIAFITLVSYSLTNAQQLHYSIDEAHSYIKFTGLLGSMMEIEGKFGQFWGDVFFDPEHPDKVSVTVLIDPTSLDTDNDWRDEHLQKEEFLHTEVNDIIVFKSSNVVKLDNLLEGELLLKGKERPIAISYKKEFGPGDDPWQNRRIIFSGSFTFSRSEFDLGPTEGFWGKSIADEAQINFTISATRQNMERMSLFKSEKIAAIWENLINDNADQALNDIEKLIGGADEKTKKRIPKMIDLLAKRSKQYGHKATYLMLLEKNRTYFPELDWVYSNQALGFLESGNLKAMEEAAKKALSINAKNALAIELLK